MFEIIINKTGKSLVDRLDAVSYNIGYYDIMSLNLPNWATSFIQSQADLSIYADLLYMQSKQYYLLSAEDTEEFKDLLRSRMLFTKEYLVENCHKAVKFALNSLLRPRTILKFFVFSNKLQVSKTEVLHFLSFFSHYSYLIEKLKIKIISDNRNFITVHQFSDMIASIDDAYIQSLNIDGFISIMGELFDFFGEDGYIPAEAAIMFFDDKKLNHIATSIFSDFLTQNKAKINRDDLCALLQRLFVRADVIEFDENEMAFNAANAPANNDSISSIENEMISSVNDTEASLESDVDTDLFPSNKDSIESFSESSAYENDEIESTQDIDLSEFDLSSDKIAHVGIEPETAEELTSEDNDLSEIANDIMPDFTSESEEGANEEEIEEDDFEAFAIEADNNETISETISEPEIDYSSLIEQGDSENISDLVAETNPDDQFALLSTHVKAEQDILSALSDLLPSSNADDTDEYAPEGAIDSITMPAISDNSDLETALNNFITEFNEINKETTSNSENNSDTEDILNDDDLMAEFSDAILSDESSISDPEIISEVSGSLESNDDVEVVSDDFSIDANIQTQSISNPDEALDDDSIANMLSEIDLSHYSSEQSDTDDAVEEYIPDLLDTDLLDPKKHELKEAVAKETSIEEQIVDIGEVILAAKDSFNNNEIGENFTDMDEDIFLLELKQHYNEESDEIC